MTRPLVVLDLISDIRDFGPMVVASQHQFTAPNRPLVVVGPNDDLDAAFENAAGIQVTGTPTMLEDAPWANRCSAAIEGAARRGIPVLGICFGHQMLAVHFASKLASWDAPKVGVEDVAFRRGGPFDEAFIPVLLTHRDYVAELGPDLVSLGEGGFGGVQAWAHRELPIWGIQSHPEATANICRTAEKNDVAHLSDDALDARESKRILARFGQIMDAE